MVGADENCVGRGGEHAGEGEQNADGGCCGNWLGAAGGGAFGLRIVVGGYAYADADGDEHEGGVAGDGGPVEGVVDYCGHGREEDPAELVYCYCAEGQGEIGEHDVEAHRQGKLVPCQ